MELQRPYDAVIFDMDGTILDTAEDLRDALNYAMAQAGRRHDFTAKQVRCFFGSGARTAICRALWVEAGLSAEDAMTREDSPVGPEEIRVVETIYRPYYAAHCHIRTRPYPGIPELLRQLRQAGIRTAVVSNKPDRDVQALCDRYFPDLFDYAAGEREPEIRKKPAPDMTRAALSALGVPACRAVYVGDSEIDLLTAENAALPCAAVSWGFRSPGFLRENGAERVFDSVAALTSCLLGAEN